MKRALAYMIEIILVMFIFSMYFTILYAKEKSSFYDDINELFRRNLILSQSSIFLDKDVIKYLDEKKFDEIYYVVFSSLKKYYDNPGIRFKIFLNISYDSNSSWFPIIISLPEGTEGCIESDSNFTVYRNWKFLKVELGNLQDIVNINANISLDENFTLDPNSIIVFSEDGNILCSKLWSYSNNTINISIYKPTKTLYIYYKEKKDVEGNIKTNIECDLDQVGDPISFKLSVYNSYWYTVYINKSGEGYLNLKITFPEKCSMVNEIKSFSDYNSSNFIFFLNKTFEEPDGEPVGSLEIPASFGYLLIEEYG